MRKNGQMKACLTCGGEFYVRASDLDQKYCSSACYGQARAKPAEEKKAGRLQYNKKHVDEKAAYNEEYMRTHREQVRAQQNKAYAERSEEQVEKERAYNQEYKAQWNVANKERRMARGKRYREEHREEMRDKALAVRRAHKQALIDLFGGVCQHCGYREMQAALQFHHIDPGSKKKLSPFSSLGPTEDVLIELEGCALLCANCHAGLHAQEWEAKWVRREGLGWTLDD